MFRGNDSEKMGPIEVVTTSNAPKDKFICACGASRFQWIATNGEIKSGGFKADEYLYRCLGCGKVTDEKQVKQFFSHF
jgi:hypothetical protein